MAHHKRRRPKHRRAGCLLCKPWKDGRGEFKDSGRWWLTRRFAKRESAAVTLEQLEGALHPAELRLLDAGARGEEF